MNKAQLIDAVAARLGGSKKAADDAVEAVLDTITREVVSGTKVSITGFGSFEKIDRPARMARNPRTGERVRVKKSSVPKFKAGQAFKDVVSGQKKMPRLTMAAGVESGARSTSRSTGTTRRTTATRAAATGTAKRAGAAKTTTRAGAGKSTAKTAGKAAAARPAARKAAATTSRTATRAKRAATGAAKKAGTSRRGTKR